MSMCIDGNKLLDKYKIYLLAQENKYYLQVYLDNCASKIGNKQITYYLEENLFEDQIL